MNSPRGLSHRRAGFTLIELLTVVGIIALLIGILVPSLARARDQAKKVKSLALLSALEKSLEVFQNDFKFYPDSDSRRYDPIKSTLPGLINGSTVQLSGAHWLARAMAGPDTQGLDSAGLLLKDIKEVTADSTTGKLALDPTKNSSGVDFFTSVQNADRKGSYVEDNKVLLKDNDPRFLTSSGYTQTGRFVFIDAFNFPVLYYKASSRAQQSFCYRPITGSSNNPALGVYDQADNEAITGSQNKEGWDFAGAGFKHGMGYFGPKVTDYLTDPTKVQSDAPPVASNYKGKSFVNALHDSAAQDAGQVIKPVKAEGFILMTPGKDGIFGTDDDISLFNQ